MFDGDALLAAILADPADDTPRLVFADWLQESGDPDRAEFIRTDVELARTPPTTEDDERRRRVLHERRADLLKRHRAEWLAPFLPYAKDSSFDRGFVAELDVPAHAFLQHAGRWFALTPLARVRITTCTVFDAGLHRRTEPLLTSPHLGRLEAIDLQGCGLTPEDVTRFAAAPDLSRLRELVLAWNAVGTDGAVVLSGMPQLAGLEALDLVGNQISDRGARAIAESRHLGGLKELRISRNPIKNRGWAGLELRFGDALVG